MADYNNGYQGNGPENGYSGGPNYQQPPKYNPPQYYPTGGVEPPPGYIQKDRKIAGILAMVLGVYGVHSFYLGNTSRGIAQICISLLTCGIGAIVMAIWGILDGVKLLDGRINTDAYGIFLKD